MQRLILSLAVFLLVGCSFGQKARDTALLPAIKVAAEGVRNDALAGVRFLNPANQPGAVAHVEDFFGIVQNADPLPLSVLTLWPMVKAHCNSGFNARLESGLLGVNTAESLRERVKQFGLALVKYFGKGPTK